MFNNANMRKYRPCHAVRTLFEDRLFKRRRLILLIVVVFNSNTTIDGKQDPSAMSGASLSASRASELFVIKAATK